MMPHVTSDRHFSLLSCILATSPRVCPPVALSGVRHAKGRAPCRLRRHRGARQDLPAWLTPGNSRLHQPLKTCPHYHIRRFRCVWISSDANCPESRADGRCADPSGLPLGVSCSSPQLLPVPPHAVRHRSGMLYNGLAPQATAPAARSTESMCGNTRIAQARQIWQV